MLWKHHINITLLVFVSMCPGDLASASVLAAIARPPMLFKMVVIHVC